MTMMLTKREQAFMDYVRRAIGNGLDGAASCRAHPLAVARKLVDRGLLVEKWAYLCDGDGYTVQLSGTCGVSVPPRSRRRKQHERTEH